MSAQQLRFALIGRGLEHSFSPRYFQERFEKDGTAHSYGLLDLEDLADLDRETMLRYAGLNVTIPYKEAIIDRLDSLSEEAAAIGAVNCIEIKEDRLIGHNTDAYGFRESLRPFLKSHHRKALILGTGGASKAVAYVLNQLGIEYLKVSRDAERGDISYEELNENALRFFPFIINTTPLGTYPDIHACPPLPYEHLNELNFLYDLVYNPAETAFLRKGREKGALTLNGESMLIAQAERSWEIWMGVDRSGQVNHL